MQAVKIDNCSLKDFSTDMSDIQGVPKIWHSLFVCLNFYQILTALQNYLIVRIRRKFVTKPLPNIATHLKCCYTTLWNVVSQKQIEKKMTSVATHFNKLTTRNTVLLSKVTGTSCSFYIKCSMCPHCCWMTHSSRWHHWPMVWSVKCCNSLPHSVTFHKVV